MGCRRQHWGLRLPLLLSMEGSCGMARYGWDGRGREEYGAVRIGAASIGKPRQGPQTVAQRASALSAILTGWLRHG